MFIIATLLLFTIFTLLLRIAVVWIVFHFTEKLHKLWPLVAAVVFFLFLLWVTISSPSIDFLGLLINGAFIWYISSHIKEHWRWRMPWF